MKRRDREKERKEGYMDVHTCLERESWGEGRRER
jgi:hypothetical protein